MLKSALAYQFTVIGEAAACVAGDLRERHPLVPWAKAKGMRNVVVHHYFGVAWDEVWRWISPPFAGRSPQFWAPSFPIPTLHRNRSAERRPPLHWLTPPGWKESPRRQAH